MEAPFKIIQNGLEALGKFFEEILSYLNPFSENFIVYKLVQLLGNLFKDMFNNIVNILNYLNPFSEKFLLKGVLDFFIELLSYLNPFSENFIAYKFIELISDLLKFLFVPTNDSFTQLQQKVNDKFYFINQIGQMFSTLLGNVDYGNNVPKFSIEYYGQTLNIIDFSLFLDYRVWLHGIILAISWFFFIRKLFNRLPTLIGGV